MFSHVKVGDKVYRAMGKTTGRPLIMELWCTELDARFIYCGAPGVGWKFSRDSGAEVDEDLGWNTRGTGTYLVKSPGEDRTTKIWDDAGKLTP